MRLQIKFFKLSALVCLLLAFSLNGNAQIDSAFVSANFDQRWDSNIQDTVDYMHCAVDVYPLSNFGSITISVYETETAIPVGTISMSKDELIIAGLLSGNTVTFDTDFVYPSVNYTIEATILTDRGAYTPKITSYYEAP